MGNKSCPLYYECPIGRETCGIDCETLKYYYAEQTVLNRMDSKMREKGIETKFPFIGNSGLELIQEE